MTALTTSPFLTPAPGRASLTVATMMSPMPAYRRPEPPSTRMHRISLAPVLSATRSRDSCWITTDSVLTENDRPRPGRPSGLLGPLENLHHAPPLGGRQWPGLHQQDAVADAAGVLLVVRLQLAGTAQDLAVHPVLDPVLDLDHHGLVHPVGHDQALPGLAPVADLGRRRGAVRERFRRSFARLRTRSAPRRAQRTCDAHSLSARARHQTSPTSRLMKRHFIGSLCIARRRASRATGSGTPDSSNITRPGLTFAIHHSGEPLPEPIRVSAGFLVSGRSGKMLIQTLPPRRMCRVIAIRADSICRFVT